jgi:hypothetical protein
MENQAIQHARISLRIAAESPSRYTAEGRARWERACERLEALEIEHDQRAQESRRLTANRTAA